MVVDESDDLFPVRVKIVTEEILAFLCIDSDSLILSPHEDGPVDSEGRRL